MVKFSSFKRVPILSYAPARRRGEEGGMFRDRVRGLLFSATARFCDIEQRRFDFSFDYYNKLNDPIVGSLVGDGSRVLNEIYNF